MHIWRLCVVVVLKIIFLNFVGSSCTSGQFDCSNDRCITESWRCDGDNDCLNFADENGCETCRGNTFRCSNGTCIRNNRVCDGVNDCRNGEDEAGCSTTSTSTQTTTTVRSNCTSGQFDCLNGLCITESWRCDGDNDCQNFADEIGCETCRGNTFRCSNGTCIRNNRVCDGVNDCRNGEDEAGCSTTSTSTQTTSTAGTTCPSGQFDCLTGRCIPESWRCDGDNDCQNLVDETGCETCRGNAFRCSNGTCIRNGLVCNGVNDCRNGEDEAVCSTTTSTTQSTSTVIEYKSCAADAFDCRNGHCTSLSWACDGDDDCGNFADEKQCGTCKEESFHCSDNTCVRTFRLCDGVRDCPLGEDEKGCNTRTSTTQATSTASSCLDQFNCGNGLCTSLSWVCDGDDDCGNGADEKQCSECTPNAFYCGNGKCVRDYRLCDGVNDCGNNLDEKNCFSSSTQFPTTTLSPTEHAETFCRNKYTEANPLFSKSEPCRFFCRGQEKRNGERINFAQYYTKEDGSSCGIDRECISERCRKSRDIALCKQVMGRNLTYVDDISECRIRCRNSVETKFAIHSNGIRCTLPGTLGDGVCKDGNCERPKN